jgi:hypothetical protein
MRFSGETTTSEAVELYEAAIAALAALPVIQLRTLDESTLLRVNSMHSQASRILGSAGAAIAGEIAYRSRPALGSRGLAQRTGHRTAENLLKATTGATKEQVITAVKAGTLLTEIADDGAVDEATGEILVPSQPWLRPVAGALASGAISTSAAQSIGRGLGEPNSAVTAAQLEAAAATLVGEAIAGVDADQLWRRARAARDELDLNGVRIREDERRQARALTHHALPGGGGKATWVMDTETYAKFLDVYDRMVSPKLGGIRFVETSRATRAETIAKDDRTPAQIASDGFLHLLALGADADDSVLIGSGAPVVRITVAERALETGQGLARIDGQADPVSIATVQRLICEAETMRIGFDGAGDATQLESEGRLFTKRQREVLAAKFGGCMHPGCDRPPSWSEAHHIQHWQRDHGKTVIENGILLCRHHHLKYHNDGIEIERDSGGTYWMIPAPNAPDRTPVLMPLKTKNLDDLSRYRRAG